jgi:DNA-binding beta-propeller fold protein YncE
MSVALGTEIRYSHSIGRLSQSANGFNNPVDVAFGAQGRLYVLNRTNMNHAPMGFLRVTACTIDEEYSHDLFKYGTGEVQIVWPTSIATDADENLYVADEQRHDVQAVTRDGQFLARIGEPGDGPGQLNRPAGVLVHPDGNVYVTDCLNHRVQRFSRDGQHLGMFGTEGSGPGQFTMPWGIAVDRAGDLYVVDWGNDRVQKLSPSGEPLATFGTSGAGEGQLRRPAGVGVDSHGNIYVSDYGNDRVQVFAADGAPMTTLLGDATMTKWGIGSVEVDPESKSLRERHPEVVARERFFRGPMGVEVDDQDRIVIADCCKHRVQVYQRV